MCLVIVTVMISVCTVQPRQDPVLHACWGVFLRVTNLGDDVVVLVQVWLLLCASVAVPTEGGLAVDVPRAERLCLSPGAKSWRHPGPRRLEAFAWPVGACSSSPGPVACGHRGLLFRVRSAP